VVWIVIAIDPSFRAVRLILDDRGVRIGESFRVNAYVDVADRVE
jgi:hypothetical protein